MVRMADPWGHKATGAAVHMWFVWLMLGAKASGVLVWFLVSFQR